MAVGYCCVLEMMLRIPEQWLTRRRGAARVQPCCGEIQPGDTEGNPEGGARFMLIGRGDRVWM